MDARRNFANDNCNRHSCRLHNALVGAQNLGTFGCLYFFRQCAEFMLTRRKAAAKVPPSKRHGVADMTSLYLKVIKETDFIGNLPHYSQATIYTVSGAVNAAMEQEADATSSSTDIIATRNQLTDMAWRVIEAREAVSDMERRQEVGRSYYDARGVYHSARPECGIRSIAN